MSEAQGVPEVPTSPLTWARAPTYQLCEHLHSNYFKRPHGTSPEMLGDHLGYAMGAFKDHVVPELSLGPQLYLMVVHRLSEFQSPAPEGDRNGDGRKSTNASRTGETEPGPGGRSHSAPVHSLHLPKTPEVAVLTLLAFVRYQFQTLILKDLKKPCHEADQRDLCSEALREKVAFNSLWKEEK